MKRINRNKLISLTLALLMTASVASCASNKKEYSTVKAEDPWYECTSFSVSDLYPAEEYEYVSFLTVGATEDTIYIMAVAEKHIEGNVRDMSYDEYLPYCERSILEYSYDGELLEKTDYQTVISAGRYSILQKAWLSDGTLNTLEEITDTNANTITYSLNGEEFALPAEHYRFKDVVFIEDIYSVSNYKLLNVYIYGNLIEVIRPDGSYYSIPINFNVNSPVDSYGSFIPTKDNKVILPVFLESYDEVLFEIDPVTGDVTELDTLFGTDVCWLEHASGKIVARDYKGFNILNESTGKMEPFCNYSAFDCPMSDAMQSELLYISDDNSKMIMGFTTYNQANQAGFKIMIFTKTDTNPHAGKTILTVSSTEDHFPEESDLLGVYLYNKNVDSFFLEYKFPYNEIGDYVDVDPDIYLDYDPVADPSDSNRYVDLAPYLDLNGGSYKDDFFANAIDAAKSGDSLYRVPLDITASGILTSSANVPQGQVGFTFEQYKTFVDEVCNGTDPMSLTSRYRFGKPEYFSLLFVNASDKFINDGKADLNNDDFRNLMLFVEESGTDNAMSVKDYTDEHNAAIQAVIDEVNYYNATLDTDYAAIYGNLYSFDSYLDSYFKYGEGIRIYGLPSFDGRGPTTCSHEFICVSASTSYPEACAEFVKIMMSYDVQITMYNNPINRQALTTIAEEQLEAYNSKLLVYGVDGRPATEADLIPHEAIDKYIDILSSSYGNGNLNNAIENILCEEASAYFNGQRSLDDVIPVMQDRIQTVLDENK